MLTLQVLNPHLEIPLPDFLRGDGSVFPSTTFAAYCIKVLKHVGTALIPVLYGGKR